MTLLALCPPPAFPFWESYLLGLAWVGTLLAGLFLAWLAARWHFKQEQAG